MRLSRPHLLGAAAALAAAIAAAIAGAAHDVASRQERGAALALRRQAVAADARARAMLADDARRFAAGAERLAATPAVRAAVTGTDVGEAHAESVRGAAALGAAWVQLTDARGWRLARSDSAGRRGVSLAGSALVGAAIGGVPAAGTGVVDDSVLVHAVATPIAGPEAGTVVGALVAARALDATVARGVQDSTATDVLFYVLEGSNRPRVVAGTAADGARLTPTVAALIAAASAAPDTAGSGVERPIAVDVAGSRRLGLTRALRSASGEVVGGVAVLTGPGTAATAGRAADRAAAASAVLAAGLLLAAVITALGAPRTEGHASAAGHSRVARVSAAVLPTALLDRGLPRAGTAELDANGAGPDVHHKFARPVPLGAVVHQLPLAADRPADVTIPLARPGMDDAPRRSPARARSQPLPSPSHGWLAPAEEAAELGLVPGHLLAGRYEIGEVIGAGGAGLVFRATDRRVGEVVALKVLRPELSRFDPLALERLASELRLARRIAHRNVVRPYDLGETDGLHFLTMEYVDGASLKQVVAERGSLPVAECVAIVSQLCRGLNAAHHHGVIHRDIKPDNLLLATDDATLKITDFGVARLAERSSGLTLTGVVMGTPAYMAPEQLRGEAIDARADVYAAGAVLYECLTGQPPFAAASLVEVIAHVLDAAPPSADAVNPSVPAALGDIVRRALAKDPAERTQSARELHDALASLLSPVA